RISCVIRAVGFKPEIGRGKLHGQVYGKKCIADQNCREVADVTYAWLAEIFVDEVRGNENNGPQQCTRGEVKAHFKAQDVEPGRIESRGCFSGENFYADHLGQ